LTELIAKGIFAALADAFRLRCAKHFFPSLLIADRKSPLAGDEEARQLSLIYSKRECFGELLFNAAASISLAVLECAGFFVQTNSYCLPINFYFELPSVHPSITWTLNYLFQAVTIFFGAFVFFSYSSAVFLVLDHSCWAIDTVKLLIEKLKANVGDDEASTKTSRREMIAKQLAAIHRAHLGALKWNEDVQALIEINFLFEFSVFSGLICLCVYTIVVTNFSSLYVLLLLIVLLSQLFAFCWMGSRVLVRIDELIATVYDIEWYRFEVSQAKVVQMMLRASQDMKGFHGVFKPLSMRTFQQVGACDSSPKEVISVSPRSRFDRSWSFLTRSSRCC
jgi:7tm Odorant receptor